MSSPGACPVSLNYPRLPPLLKVLFKAVGGTVVVGGGHKHEAETNVAKP